MFLMSVLQRAGKYHTSPSPAVQPAHTDEQHATVEKAQLKLLYLRKLKRAKLPPEFLLTFYRGFIECILTKIIMACNSSSTASIV